MKITLKYLGLVVLTVFSVTLGSCGDTSKEKVSASVLGQSNSESPKTTSSLETESEVVENTAQNQFFSELLQQIVTIRSQASGKWRYDASTYRCPEAANTIKCYEFSYHTFVSGCTDIVGKPCLEKLLIVRAERNIEGNSNVDQIIDTTETIVSFQLHAKNESIKNSDVIGKNVEAVKGRLGDATTNENSMLIYQLQEGEFTLNLVGGKIKSISFRK